MTTLFDLVSQFMFLPLVVSHFVMLGLVISIFVKLNRKDR